MTDDRFVPKVHPLARQAEEDDPFELVATPAVGDSDRELLAVLQLFRAQRQILFKFQIEKGKKVAEIPVRLPSGQIKVQELYSDTVIGFNKLGKEVVRVTIDEPVMERPKEKHANSI